ncbi:MAG: hypothetical protein K9N35_08310 [Candidatus Marinimicrobia bacterium]|nr:hypothetical protein [Candidatus Neomarinimicrobiota bacterium]
MEEIFKSILDTLNVEPLYLILGAVIVVFIVFMMLKKLFKIAMMLVIVALLYFGYLFLTDAGGLSGAKQKGKAVIEKIDEATEDARGEAVDKIIDELEQKRKEVSKKK